MKCARCQKELSTGDSPSSFYCGDCQNIIDSVEPKPYTCPVCNGQGNVSRPPWIPGDQDTWTSAGAPTYECQACKGTGIVWKE